MSIRPLVLAAAFCLVSSSAILSVVADDPVDKLAVDYIRLLLRVGQYVPDYIDAYFGPADLKEDAAKEEVEKGFPYERLCEDQGQLLARVRELGLLSLYDSDRGRLSFMESQLTSLRGVLDRHNGIKLSFDDVAAAIYGVEAPRHDSTYYDSLRVQLESMLPGSGDLSARFQEYHEKFIVPRHLIDSLVKLCVVECRARTNHYLVLPQGESCRVELVGGQSWGGYNWFLGDGQSLVQIDTTDEPYVEELIDMAAHEGYPGHHLANVIRESHLVKDSGWVEHSVNPLFCPQSVLDEGMANLAPDLVLPHEERITFYKTAIFPILNLDTALAGPYCRIIEAKKRLMDVDLEIARNYLDGTFDSTRAINWLCRYTLTTEEGALRSLRFTDDFRSYRVTYTVGEGLIKDYLLRNGGTPDNPGKRWGLFYRLIASPVRPSDLN